MQEHSINESCVGAQRNAVVVVAIGKSEMWEIGKKSVEKYCEKYNFPLEILTKKRSKVEGFGIYNYFNFFEKNQVYHLFKKYDRILRLDWDLNITPNCPNLFEVVPEDKIGVVYEDVGNIKSDRRGLIKKIQNLLGNVGWTKGYFNSGVMVVSKKHKEIFNTNDDEIEMVRNLNLRSCEEQTYINYLVKKLGFEIFELNYKFNHLSVFSESWNGFPNRLKSYIIHYAGTPNPRLMKADYERLYLEKFTIRGFLIDFKEKFFLFEIIYYSWKIFKNRCMKFSNKRRKILSFLKSSIIAII